MSRLESSFRKISQIFEFWVLQKYRAIQLNLKKVNFLWLKNVMPRGKKLTEREKGLIEAYHREKISNREIARRLKRSHHVVDNFLNNPQLYGVKKSSGRPPKLSPRQKRHIVNVASNSTITINQIRQEQDLSVSKSTVSRVLKQSPHIVRSKMNVVPRLKPHHIKNRLEFARIHMDTNWENVSYNVLHERFVGLKGC